MLQQDQLNINQVCCISNTYDDGDIIEGLTKHKIYNVQKHHEALDVIYIINDLGKYEGYYIEDFFITMDEWREQQLNKIL